MPIEQVYEHENMRVTSNSGINNIIERNSSYFLLFSKKKIKKKVFKFYVINAFLFEISASVIYRPLFSKRCI